jgi:hypothetical protein
MTTYPTKYSNLNELNKKERKQKVIVYPWIAPNSNLTSVDWCGQRVLKLDIGTSIKFCPLCDQPMIVRMMILPCEHMMCYSCTKPDTDACYM